MHSAKPELQGDDANSANNNLQSLETERMGQHDKETHTALHYSVSAGTVISVIPILSPEYEVQSTNSAPRRCPQSIIWALALRHLVWKLKFKRWRLLLFCSTNICRTQKLCNILQIFPIKVCNITLCKYTQWHDDCWCSSYFSLSSMIIGRYLRLWLLIIIQFYTS